MVVIPEVVVAVAVVVAGKEVEVDRRLTISICAEPLRIGDSVNSKCTKYFNIAIGK